MESYNVWMTPIRILKKDFKSKVFFFFFKNGDIRGGKKGIRNNVKVLNIRIKCKIYDRM